MFKSHVDLARARVLWGPDERDQVAGLEGNRLVLMQTSGAAPFGYPFYNNRVITDPFGVIRASGSTHTGVDLDDLSPDGTNRADEPAIAMSSGEVIDVFNNDPTRGNGLAVRPMDANFNGYDGRPDWYWYHLKEPVTVAVGDQVMYRQPLGIPGKTGRTSGSGNPNPTVGTHLHVGVKNRNGVWIDPVPLMRAPKPLGQSINDDLFWTQAQLAQAAAGANLVQLIKNPPVAAGTFVAPAFPAPTASAGYGLVALVALGVILWFANSED